MRRIPQQLPIEISLGFAWAERIHVAWDFVGLNVVLRKSGNDVINVAK